MEEVTAKAIRLIQEGEIAKAIEPLREAAASGDVEALFQLGLLYFHGKGVEPDGGIAADLLKQAYIGGHVKAPFYLGRLNASLHEYELAFEWYEIGAELGYHVCMGRLGLCYLRGEGVPQSSEKAFKYFQKAREMGNLRAGARYIRMLFYGHRGISGIFLVIPELFRHVANGAKISKADQRSGRNFDERFII